MSRMTLEHFGSWALGQGQVGNPTDNPANLFMGECVSLIQQYIWQVHGIAYKPRGHAVDWNRNPLAAHGWVALLYRWEDVRPGDIIVSDAWPSNRFGHIALIDINRMYFDQNGILSRRIAWQRTPLNLPWRTILRRTGWNPKPIPPTTNTPTPEDNRPQIGDRVTTTATVDGWNGAQLNLDIINDGQSVYERNTNFGAQLTHNGIPRAHVPKGSLRRAG